MNSTGWKRLRYNPGNICDGDSIRVRKSAVWMVNDMDSGE